MKLSLKISENEAVLSREKWGVIAYTLFGDALCIMLGATFVYLAIQQTWEPALFPILFGAIFGLLGLSHLVFVFPKLAKNLFVANGLHVLVANKDGLALNKGIGCQPNLYKWDDISEIVLVNQLQTIETDETSYTWNVLVVMVTPESIAGMSFFKRANIGVSTTQNGKGYTLGNYPRQSRDELANTLQRFIKRPHIIKCYEKATFNIKGDAAILDTTHV